MLFLSSKKIKKIGTWNVRTMYETNNAAQIVREQRAYNITVLGLGETRWTQTGQVRLNTGEMILYSGHEEEDAHHTGVAFNRSSCSSSPSPRLVHRLRHPVLFVVCLTPSCSSSPSPRLVHHLCHPVLFIVSVSPSCSSSPSPHLVHRLRHSVLSVVSVAPYSFCIHTRSYIITISY